MQIKVLLALGASVIVAGLPEPDPETNVDVKVDSGDSKADSYFQVVETAGETSFKLVSKLLGPSNGDKCCKVKVPFSYNPVRYDEYPNGATDVPCGGRLAGKNGTCVDGNVVCDIDNMGTASSKVTFKVDNDESNENRSIMVDVVPGSSVFDVMLIAQQEDSKFRFTYTVFQGGIYVTGIDGVQENFPAGAEKGWIWALYNCTETCRASHTGVLPSELMGGSCKALQHRPIVIQSIKLDSIHICKMQVKIVLLLVGVALVAGMPEPDPETQVDVKVDAGDSKLDGYLDVIKSAAGASVNLMTNFFGKSNPDDKCCKVDTTTYDNGAMNVPCGPKYPPGTLGKCVDGNVVCESG